MTEQCHHDWICHYCKSRRPQYSGEILLRKVPNGLVPFSDEDSEALRRYKVGDMLRVKVAKVRNAAFFRRWWLLVKLAFDVWSEGLPDRYYKGKEIEPNFDRFRKDLIILCGFYKPVWNYKGELRVEHESIAWANMTEERFTELYDKTIDVILKQIIPDAGYDEATLRDVVESVLEFGA